MEEIWKDVVGYEGRYKVSNTGKVRGLLSGKILKPYNQRGYLFVCLRVHQKGRNFSIHRLVASAFVERQDGKTDVNHTDGNKANNNADNLEWVTKSENIRHAIGMGLRPANPTTGRFGKDSPKSRIILQYGLDGKFVHKWYGFNEIKRNLNYGSNDIREACLKHRASHGFYWAYGD